MLAEQSLSRYDCIPHTPDFYALSSIGIWGRLSMSGYSPMVRVTSSITSLLLILLFLPPFRSDWAIKRITPKGISNRGFPSTHPHQGCHSMRGICRNEKLQTIHETLSEWQYWIIISTAKIVTFYKIANFFVFYLIFYIFAS